MEIITWIKSWYARAQQLPWFNKYTVTLSVFVLWMLFFDKNNMIVQYRLSHTLNRLENEIQYNEQELQRALDERYVLETHTEKYAREKYYMHKPDEDVFIIVDKDQ